MLCPFADIRLLHPENENEPGIVPTQYIVHSAVTSSDSLFGWFDREDVSEESHFWVAKDGRIEQYIDTERQADAQWDGNLHGVSVETWDDRDPNHVPWTPAQLDSLVRIGHWLRDVHAIPMRVCPGPQSSGVGYHRLFTEWNRNFHTCPGDIRVIQFTDELMPRLAAEEDDLTPEQEAKLDLILAKLDRTSPSGVSLTHDYAKQAHLNIEGWVMPKLGEVDTAVDNLTPGVVDLEALAEAVAARLYTGPTT